MSLQKLSGIWPELNAFTSDWSVVETVEAECFYSLHLEKQERDVKAYQRDLQIPLPVDLAYHSLPSLSSEEREKLIKARPATLAAASRISGITPTSLIALHKHVKHLPNQPRTNTH